MFNFREYRAGLGMTQEEFAEVTGVTPVTISRLETGVVRHSRKVELYICEQAVDPRETARGFRDDDEER